MTLEGISRLVNSRKLLEAQMEMERLYAWARHQEKLFVLDRLTQIAMQTADDDYRLQMFREIEALALQK